MREQFGPSEQRTLPENVIAFPAHVWQGSLPPDYNAHQEAVQVVAEKAVREILAAVEYARGCGCLGCYRRAEHTYGWYTGLDRKLKP